MRRAFNLKRNELRLLLENLKKIYRLRDLAIFRRAMFRKPCCILIMV